MIKRLYLANGYLAAPLELASDDVAVDASIAALLDANLNVSDHCYLTLWYKGKLEVIQIKKTNWGYESERAQSGTKRQGFPLGTKIVYRLTSAEILDAVQFIPWNVYADQTGYANVVGANGNWTISADAVHADTLGGITAYTEDNELLIQDKSGMFGCCDGTLTGAPHIPGPIFYFTSMLYSLEAFDIMTPQPKDKNGNAIPPINFDENGWYLLTQPQGIERYFSTSMFVYDWNVFGSQGSFSALDRYISNSMGIHDWDIFGTQGEFTAPPEKYIWQSLFPLSMQLFGGEVNYTFGLDKYLWPTAVPLDWTLE